MWLQSISTVKINKHDIILKNASRWCQHLLVWSIFKTSVMIITVEMLCNHTEGLDFVCKQAAGFHVSSTFSENTEVCLFLNWEPKYLWKLMKIEDIKCHIPKFLPQFEFLKNIKRFVRNSNLESSKNFWSHCILILLC